MANDLILGSASPRRSELLAQLGLTFEVRPIEIEESELVRDSDTIVDSVTRIARAKFAAFTQRHGDDTVLIDTVLITADTLVACRGQILGKPDDNDHLTRMLHNMSGADLDIATAICTGTPPGEARTQAVTTSVGLRELTSDEIAAYVATGIGVDKAGGLALQSEAGPFIRSVTGCWSNVLGLPLCAVVAGLEQTTRSCSPQMCAQGLSASAPGTTRKGKQIR